MVDLKDPQQANGYAYSNNNPVTFTDPSGKFFNGLMAIIVATITAITVAIVTGSSGNSGGGGGTTPYGSANYGGGSPGLGGASCGGGYPVTAGCGNVEPEDPRAQGSFKDFGQGALVGAGRAIAGTLDLGVKLTPTCWVFGDCSPSNDAYEEFVKDHKLQKDNKAFDAGDSATTLATFFWGMSGLLKSLSKKLLSGAAKESPWGLPPNQRGFKIEDDVFGGSNLPNNFPTIDYWDASTGAAISYKSIDTAAKSYQKMSSLKSTANGFVTKMEKFNGASYSGATVGATQIKSRGLKIAVPATTTPEQWKVLNQVASDAVNKGVNVTVHEVK